MQIIISTYYSPTSCIILISLLWLICCCKVMGVLQNFEIPALFAFGDSTVDQGNNNALLKTFDKCNFPPYGRDFEGGLATGRFSNGRTPPDLIAMELGITNQIPAYLDPNLKDEDLPKGVSFASGGAGYDPETSRLVSVISMLDQLEQYKQYIWKLKRAVGETKSNFILANSLYLVVAGSDDLANNYFSANNYKTRLHYTISSYTDIVIEYASSFVQELYNLGARRIAVFNTPPIGCLPSQRTQGGGILRMCVENYNEAAKLLNSKLLSEINSLNQMLPQSRIVYTDIYNPLLNIIQHPQNYGFEITNKGCCGTGLTEAAVFCNKFSGTCYDESKYIFWDSYHPTEKGYRALLNQSIDNLINSFV